MLSFNAVVLNPAAPFVTLGRTVAAVDGNAHALIIVRFPAAAFMDLDEPSCVEMVGSGKSWVSVGMSVTISEDEDDSSLVEVVLSTEDVVVLLGSMMPKTLSSSD
ncbi:hypothetical protein CEP53_012797 [Fusarium sp. AF-6]|nr:hypothetical protein CEP53_012797 [Fusarium sp. AF-6]